MVIEGFDQGPKKARLATFVRKVLKRLLSINVLLKTNWSGSVKGKGKKSNEGNECSEMISLRSFTAIITLMKGEKLMCTIV